MKKTALALLVAVLLVAQAEAQYGFANRANRLGWADMTGNASVWFDFGEPINVASHQVPLRLHFSSDQKGVADSVLGYGWWFPLIESSVYERSDTEVVMGGLGGERIALLKHNDGNYYSKDQIWQAKAVDDKFVAVIENELEMVFREGLLHSVHLPDGSAVTWVRKNGKVVAIRESGKDLVSISYNQKTGLIGDVKFGENKSLNFSHSQTPVYRESSGVPVPIAMPLTIERIETNFGYSARIENEGVVRDDGSIGVSIHEFDETDGENKISIFWDPLSLEIVEDDRYYYSVEKNPTGPFANLRLESKSSPSDNLSYYYSPESMYERYELSNGVEQENWYIGTPGGAFGKTRRIVRSDASRSEVKVFEYSSDGRVTRIIRNREVEFLSKERIENGILHIEHFEVNSENELKLMKTVVGNSNRDRREVYPNGMVVRYKDWKPHQVITPNGKTLPYELILGTVN